MLQNFVAATQLESVGKMVIDEEKILGREEFRNYIMKKFEPKRFYD